jgi:hypothetical protein
MLIGTGAGHDYVRFTAVWGLVRGWLGAGSGPDRLGVGVV